ncbi:MAG: hypothetical protein CMB64_01120 [Euryarchaeota archaeon]|nr:hypothetical protein [Euryarchaeota archaeon]|tara:strand:+ start:502 stop:870 length:369 start_codon:yes stop_codon:yes gene_type:complete
MEDEEFFTNEDSYRFFQLVHMFQRTVMMNLGLMEYEGQRFYDLNEAKEGIELLRMLQKKTIGNLDEKETSILSGVISEVQMAFVSAPEREVEYNKNKEEEEKIKQAFTNPQEGPSETIIEEE